MPPLLHLHPRKVAIERERAELRRHGHSEENIRVEEWAVATHSLSILLTASWLVVFLSNLVSLTLTLTLLILMGIELSTEIAMLLLTAMLPYYVGSTFTPILCIGKRLTLKDEDFRAVFQCQCGHSPVRSVAGLVLLLQECGRLLSVEASAAALSEDQ